MASNTTTQPVPARRALLAGLAALAFSSRANAMAVRMRVGGTGVANGALRELRSLVHEQLGIAVEITKGLGTSGGIRAVAGTTLDVSVGARPLLPAERDQGLSERVWGSTPLVFATRADNPTNGLTSQQAVSLIAGETTRWEDGSRVRITRRPALDSDTQILAGLSAPMARAVAALQRRPGVLTAVSDSDKADALEAAPGSFGVLGLGQMISEKRALKPLSLDGRLPTDPAWPMHKPLVLVFRSSSDVWVNDFLSFLVSEPARTALGPLVYNIGEVA